MICDVLKELGARYNFKKICEEMFEDPREYIGLTDCIVEKVTDFIEDMKSSQRKEENKEKVLMIEMMKGSNND